MFGSSTLIPRKKLGKSLGRRGSEDWYEHDGAEVAVRRSPTSEPVQPDRLYVTEATEEVKHGSRHVAHLSFAARRYPAGTYAANVRRPAKRSRAPRTWDALAAVHEHREPARIRFEATAGAEAGVMAKAAGVEVREPWIEISRDGAQLSVGGLVDWLEHRGVTLEVARGHLVARSSRPMGVAERDVLSRAEALLVGFLINAPLGCVLCSQPAVTVAWPSAPVCESHAGH